MTPRCACGHHPQHGRTRAAESSLAGLLHRRPDLAGLTPVVVLHELEVAAV